MMILKTCTILVATVSTASSIVPPSNPSQSPVVQHFDYAQELQGNDTCSLINIVMDESGSMSGEQEFMRSIAVPEILGHLKEAGVDHIFVCSHGFGSIEHDKWGLDSAHFHGCTEGTINGLLVSDIMDSWVSYGSKEDGWQAIQFAIRDIPKTINGKDILNTCKSLGRNMILVTDEERYDGSCDGHFFHMEMKADKFGGEISWILKDSEGAMIAQEGAYQANELVRITKCLSDSKGYTLTFYDAYNDGFCCNNGEGYYKIWIDDVLIADSLADFEHQINILLPSGVSFVEDIPIDSITSPFVPQIPIINNFTLENTIEALESAGYRLNVITNFTMDKLQLNGALGVSSEATVFESKAGGSYRENLDYQTQAPVNLVDISPIVQEYASIAFATGGGAWRLDFLRDDGDNARSFASAFAEMIAQDIEDDTFLSEIPSSAPSEFSSVPSALPSRIPSVLPTEAETPLPPKVDTESIPHGSSIDSRTKLIGSVTGGLLTMVVLAFLLTKKRRAPLQKVGPADSITDLEEESGLSCADVESESSEEDNDAFSFVDGLARCMEAANSFLWENDQDHIVDLSELTGEIT